MLLRSLACLTTVVLSACTPKDDPADTTQAATEVAPTTTAADTTATGEPTGGGTTTTGEPTGGATTTDDGATDDATTGAAEPDVCACIDDEAHFDTYTCAIGPCGMVVIDCDVVSGDQTPGCELEGGVFSIDEAALDCSLVRLIAGDEGAVGYRVESNGPGQGGGVAHVLPGRQAMFRTWTFYDLGGSDTNAGIAALKDAAYFTDCKAMADLAERYFCFRQWTEEEPPATCDVGSSYEDL